MAQQILAAMKPELAGITVFERLQIPVLLQKDTLIDEKYVIQRVVGVGGQGQVYDAQQLALDRRVALKLLRTRFDDKEAPIRFLREAKILSAIQHRNLPLFYGYGLWDGQPYMAIEWIDGQSLAQTIAAGVHFSVKLAADIVMQLAEGLACAHANGVVHRDIKPENIMLETSETGELVVKLVDFGLCGVDFQSAGQEQRLTEAGCAVGTAMYMSPEQCLGQRATSVSDIYSVGCIFYVCLTGKTPFMAETPMALMIKHTVEPLPRLDSNAGLPNNLVLACQTVLDKCTAKDPASRYQSCRDLVVALQNLLAAEELDVDQPGFGPSGEKRTSERSLGAKGDTTGGNRLPLWKRIRGYHFLLASLLCLACGFVWFFADGFAAAGDAVFESTKEFGVKTWGAKPYSDFFLSMVRAPSPAALRLATHLYDWSSNPSTDVPLAARTQIVLAMLRQLNHAGDHRRSERISDEVATDLRRDIQLKLTGPTSAIAEALPQCDALWQVERQTGHNNFSSNQLLYIELALKAQKAGIKLAPLWYRRSTESELRNVTHDYLRAAGSSIAEGNFSQADSDVHDAISISQWPAGREEWLDGREMLKFLPETDNVAPSSQKDKQLCAKFLGDLRRLSLKQRPGLTRAEELAALRELDRKLGIQE